MPGSCLQAHHSTSNSVRPLSLPLSWIPVWACHGTSFSLMLFSFFFLQFFQTGKFWVRASDFGVAIPSLHLMSCPSTGGGLYKFPLPTVKHFVQASHCRVLHQSSLPLSPESLPPPRSPVHSKASSHFLPWEVACFHSFCWPSGLQSCFCSPNT